MNFLGYTIKIFPPSLDFYCENCGDRLYKIIRWGDKSIIADGLKSLILDLLKNKDNKKRLLEYIKCDINRAYVCLNCKDITFGYEPIFGSDGLYHFNKWGPQH